jgi:hypothetical protein
MKGSLQAMRAVLDRQTFDCFYRSSIAPQREHEAGWHRLAVGEDGASATLAGITADLRARQARHFAQVVDQKLVFGDSIVAPSAVQPQMYELFLDGFRLPLRHDSPPLQQFGQQRRFSVAVP